MISNPMTRRQFLEKTIALAGTAWVAPWPGIAAEGAKKRTAVDQVVLGNTGIKLSRLGFGAGSNSGNVQRALGHEAFNKLVRYAYDRGITYFDTAQGYQTHTWIREAIKGLPREKLYIQSKISGTPEKPLEVIDRFREELGTDYIDSLLVHCATTKNWDDERKRTMDAVAEAKEKKWIRAKGVSCHSLPALHRAAVIDWVDVHLVRVNPQGAWVDTPAETWNAKSDASNVPAVMEELKGMRAKGHGVIGMKLIGNGEFTKAEDREKAAQFAMKCGLLDAVVIGFKSPAEIDEAIDRLDRALAEA
jgi:1-deoxyxylulose-5-phosphate synthase